jgi:hypothetical protein
MGSPHVESQSLNKYLAAGLLRLGLSALGLSCLLSDGFGCKPRMVKKLKLPEIRGCPISASPRREMSEYSITIKRWRERRESAGPIFDHTG